MTGHRDVWITGIGLVSCAGEGSVAHDPRTQTTLRIDEQAFAPYVVHPLCPVDFATQIPKVSEQRQMGLWQRTGVYAAGLALQDAGLIDRPDILERTHLVTAAGNGERDCSFDAKVLASGFAEDAVRLNEALLTGLRPTLYLGELSNLLAGNISIVHHVTGSSRTFKGEEIAGVSAVENAVRRIEAGQGDVFLVGGALNAEREDLLLGCELAGNLWSHPYTDVWSRSGKGGGFIPGSMGAFLVLEASACAQARGVEPYARISQIRSARCRRQPGECKAALQSMFSAFDIPRGALAVMSGASGVEPSAAEERSFITSLKEDEYAPAIRAHGSWLGHGIEAHFPAGVCLAALSLDSSRLHRPWGCSEVEADFEGDLARVLVTGVGHWRGEGLALLERVE